MSKEELLQINEKLRLNLLSEEKVLKTELQILEEQYNKKKERLQCIRILDASIDIYGEKIDYTPFILDESVIELSKKINTKVTTTTENLSNPLDENTIKLWKKLDENTEKLKETLRIQEEQRNKIELESILKQIKMMENNEKSKNQTIEEEMISYQEFFRQELQKKEFN